MAKTQEKLLTSRENNSDNSSNRSNDVKYTHLLALISEQRSIADSSLRQEQSVRIDLQARTL